MGNTVCTDKVLLSAEDIQAHRLKFKPNAEQLKQWEQSNSFSGYEHNIRAFSYQFNKNLAPGGQVKVSRSGVAAVPINLSEDIQLDPTHSYVVMHLQRVPASKAAPPKGYDYATPDTEHTSFAKTCEQTFTPRGISAMFSVDISALKRRSMDTSQQPYVYLFKLYVYNGKKASSLVSAVAVMSAFTIEKLLLKNTDFVAAMFYNGFTTHSPAPFQTPTSQDPALTSSSRGSSEAITLYRDHAFLRSFYNMLSPSEQQMNNTLRSTVMSNGGGDNSPNSTARRLNVPPLGFSASTSNSGNVSKLPSGFNLNLNKVGRIITEDHDDVKQPPAISNKPMGLGLNLGGITKGGPLGLNLANISSKIESTKKQETEDGTDEGLEDYDDPNAREKRLAAHKYIASEVYPKVFVGGEHARTRRENLIHKGVSVVINAVGTVGDGTLPNLYEQEFQYLTLMLSDDPTETIDSFFPVVNHLIHTTTTEKGEGVFIHCHQGVSRSATLALAYMMWREGLPFESARIRARKMRPIISPNSGFIARLIDWGKFLSSPPNSVLYAYTRYNKRCPLPFVFRRVIGSASTTNLIDTASCYVALERANASEPYAVTFFSGAECDEVMADDARELMETLMPFAFYTNKEVTNDGVTFTPVTFDFSNVTEIRGDAARMSTIAERILGMPVTVGRFNPNANLEKAAEMYQNMIEERRVLAEGASRRKRAREDILAKIKQNGFTEGLEDEEESRTTSRGTAVPATMGGLNLGGASKPGGLSLNLGSVVTAPIATKSDLNDVFAFEYPFTNAVRMENFFDESSLESDNAYALVFVAPTMDADHEVVLWLGNDCDVTEAELIQAYLTNIAEVDGEGIIISDCKPTPAGEISYSVVREGKLPYELARRIE